MPVARQGNLVYHLDLGLVTKESSWYVPMHPTARQLLLRTYVADCGETADYIKITFWCEEMEKHR